DKLILFSTAETGQVVYDPNLRITDNILGKSYSLDSTNTDSTKLIAVASNSEQFINSASTPNERAVATYLDDAILNGNYDRSQYAMLSELENNPTEIYQLEGEIYASATEMRMQSTYLTVHNIYEQLRNVPLVTYTGNGTVPDNGNGTVAPVAPSSYEAGYGNYETGGWDTAPYGTGYAPAYEPGSPLGYNPNIGTGRSVIQRGQAQYGDPGTLIYSAWFNVLGSTGTVKEHVDQLGYDTKQAGAVVGMDLFGCTDCRFGVFYSYQKDQIRKTPSYYGKLDTQDHLLGIYHQFGDEFVYNIAMLRAGYDRYKSDRSIEVGSMADTLKAKYNGWNAGADFERGANFKLAPFILSPYGALHYTYLSHQKFTESSTNDTGLALMVKSKGDHSLRSELGGRLILDLYPGSQQLRFVLRANWNHEFLNGGYGKTNSSFVSMPTTAGDFVIQGNTMGRDWGLAGAGVEWTIIPAFQIFANYDYLANKYFRDNYGSAGLKLRW
ncbi:MAG: autotransporter outer membrane beta-barrel domain-containing protein, partial [Thermoguttaceae bacterium]|nr:autotransporter outer membrane beta-barrel domain-containing protein [Thermoguttaceae bacterium]